MPVAGAVLEISTLATPFVETRYRYRQGARRPSHRDGAADLFDVHVLAGGRILDGQRSGKDKHLGSVRALDVDRGPTVVHRRENRVDRGL